ncbi:MAG: hypothetical protein HQM15_11865 [Deltaproteobacteria bacterium]|nr:hypothetical protein [Deltaproteobacteria bacterium]
MSVSPIQSTLLQGVSTSSSIQKWPPTFDVAANYLGLNRQTLSSTLKNGQSLAEIATANGKSVAGLKASMLDATPSDQKAALSQKIDQLLQAHFGHAHKFHAMSGASSSRGR